LAAPLRVRPELQHLCRFGAQWATDRSAERGSWAPFHIVTNGACVIDLTGLGRSIRLDAGDVALLPHGSRHVVRGPTTPPGAAGPFGIEARPGEAILVKSNTGGEPDTQLVCGRLRFDEVAQNLVLGALPEAIVVAAAEGPVAGRVRQLATGMMDELDGGRPGAAAVAVDLASALLVMVVRAHLERESASDGLLGLLGHPQAGPAVAAMLADPGSAWSLDELAARANASREPGADVPEKGARGALGSAGRAEAGAGQAEAEGDEPAPGRDRRRGRLPLRQRLQPRLCPALRHAAGRGEGRRRLIDRGREDIHGPDPPSPRRQRPREQRGAPIWSGAGPAGR
jgi:AraC family transcriptional activator of mtrCDE